MHIYKSAHQARRPRDGRAGQRERLDGTLEEGLPTPPPARAHKDRDKGTVSLFLHFSACSVSTSLYIQRKFGKFASAISAMFPARVLHPFCTLVCRRCAQPYMCSARPCMQQQRRLDDNLSQREPPRPRGPNFSILPWCMGYSVSWLVRPEYCGRLRKLASLPIKKRPASAEAPNL